eukprot:s3086_g16.t1
MPKPEKKKAPEIKAMPRAKAPKLSEETDKALKKLEALTEAAEQAVWLDNGGPYPKGIRWRWQVVAIRAVQHNKAAMEHAKLSNIVKRVFMLDPTFQKTDLDSDKFPLTNLRPDLVPELFREILE